ncbi:hypothetical protein C8J56DRAFT_1004758 [Mycena floridula]|nr:hypothetical protein C8J56DRAFT_1004758 [Mycena floridula]
MLRASPLRGFQIPGTTGRLITSLFADDTTVFMHAEDSFAVLQQLLNKWCLAASAKFNASKAELIPVGPEEYRQQVIETRKLNPNQEQIPLDVHIVQDGESVRILGAQIGNKCEDSDSWTRTLETIDSAIERSGKTHPTLEGKRHTVQMTVAAMTQYRSQVASMPKVTMKRINQIQQMYIWNGAKSSTISKDILAAGIEKGGKKISSIESRNEAIDLMRLKTYLNLDPESRPTWTFLADTLIKKRRNVSKDNIASP